MSPPNDGETVSGSELRRLIGDFLGLVEADPSGPVAVLDVQPAEGYSRKLVSYESRGESIRAYLFEPEGRRLDLAVVALHQHNGQWHLGKSEVAGLAGDSLQSFGPALARAGVTVLSPDAVGFESRRGPLHTDVNGGLLAPPLDPSRGSSIDDWLQYYNLAMHRLVRGELLMRRILEDTSAAVGSLQELAGTANIGVLGHSYGGNVALFAAALDTRLTFAVSSGAACSYAHKLAHGVGLEMALVIPGFAARFDLDDLLRCVAPRDLFIVSSEDDPYTGDAEGLVAGIRPEYSKHGRETALRHLRTPGPHALDRQRFDAIVDWVAARP